MDSLKENITDDYLKNLDKNIIEFLNQKVYDRNQIEEKNLIYVFSKMEKIKIHVYHHQRAWRRNLGQSDKYNEDCPFYKK